MTIIHLRAPRDSDLVEADIKAARDEYDRIGREGYQLRQAVCELVRAFAEKHSIPCVADLDEIEQRIEALTMAAKGPAYRRRIRLEDAQ